MLLLFVLACTGPTKTPGGPGDSANVDTASGGGGGGGGGDDTAPIDEPLYASLTGVPAFEPFLGTPPTFQADFSPGASAEAVVLDASGETVATLDVGADGLLTWSGERDTGELAPPGTYTISLHATLGEQQASDVWSVASVRLGVAGGNFQGARIPLIWHRTGGNGRYVEPSIKDDALVVPAWIAETEAAPTLAAPWADLDAAPDEKETALSLPVAYSWDASPELSLTFGGAVGTAEVLIEPRIAGWTLSTGDAAPGSTALLVKDGALAAGPAVVEESLTLEYWVEDTVIATQDIPVRMYALLGPPTFDRTGVPYGPWVAAVDPALRDISGVAPDAAAVLDALVDHIYNDLGLSYDTRYGASAYVSYQGGWTQARFSFSDFLRRRNGDIINCTDAAAILGAYANMVGADLSYMIIDPSFSLNYILAIGGTSFTSCPFGPGGCGFSYHAVTSTDGGDTIYDATLSIDGDGDPGNTPHTQVLVQSIVGADYLKALVRSGSPSYHSESKGTIQ